MRGDFPRSRDERFLPADGDAAPEEQSPRAPGGETLAEKIERYRRAEPDGHGDAPAPVPQRGRDRPR